MKSNARVASQDSRREQQPTHTTVDLTDTLSADEVSDWLGIHRDEVLREAATGEPPSLLIGCHCRFPRAWLSTLSWMDTSPSVHSTGRSASREAWTSSRSGSKNSSAKRCS